MATTYYVATASSSPAGSDENPGTITQPWLTFAKAVSSISAGDTVYLRAGTWTEKLEINSKSFASWTTFQRYPSDPEYSVIIDGTDYTPGEYEDAMVWVEDSTYVRINGLYVRVTPKFGMVVWGGSHVEFLNNKTYDTGNSGIICWYASNLLFQGNDISVTNNIDRVGAGGRDGECLSIAGGSSYVEVTENVIHDGAQHLDGGAGGEGLNIKDGCSYIYVHHNTIRDLNVTGSTSRYSCGVDGWDAETHHLYFYDNLAYNNGYGFIVECEKSAGSVHDVYLYNNIAYDMTTSGISFLDWVSDSPKVIQGLKQDIFVYNNTVHDCPRGIHFITNESNPRASNYDNIVVRNNLFANCTTEVTYDTGVQTEEITYDHNLASGDFDFDDLPNHDFHIGVDSAAKDTGTTVTGGAGSPYTDVSEDYDGVSRPQGSAFDVGAYEYGGSVPIGVPVLTAVR